MQIVAYIEDIKESRLCIFGVSAGHRLGFLDKVACNCDLGVFKRDEVVDESRSH